jgi:Cu-Zn family superoxide dismutase
MRAFLYAAKTAIVLSAAMLTTALAQPAQPVTVEMVETRDTGTGGKVGIVILSQTASGVRFEVSLSGLAAGRRGFHIHENGDCGPGLKDGKMTAGEGAGSHYDPDHAKSHKGPEGQGHRGDLPMLRATKAGARQTVTAPRLSLAEVRGRTLVIHENRDNYSDKPESGGSGRRIACGVIPR